MKVPPEYFDPRFPYKENFPVAQNLIDKKAALRGKNSADIVRTVTELLANNEKAVKMGRNALAIIDDNAGAVKKAIELIRGYIGTA